MTESLVSAFLIGNQLLLAGISVLIVKEVVEACLVGLVPMHGRSGMGYESAPVFPFVSAQNETLIHKSKYFFAYLCRNIQVLPVSKFFVFPWVNTCWCDVWVFDA